MSGQACIRFLADMGVSPRTVKWLRSEGHDAVRLNEEGLHRLTDPEVLAKSLSEGRILLRFIAVYPVEDALP